MRARRAGLASPDQTRRVRLRRRWSGSLWRSTAVLITAWSSTSAGTMAMPVPAATQATMAWYELISRTRS